MKFNLNKKQTLSIAGVLAAGVVLAWLILGTNKPQPEGEGETHGSPAETASHDNAAAAPQKGPHGGKLFTQDGYGTEVAIFEQGVEPEFRIYTYQDGKPLDPAASQVSIALDRLGRPPQAFTFVKEKDYLKGDAAVEEPHSFKVTIAAQYGNKPYRFAYEQVEARVSMTDQQLKQNNVEVLTAGPARIKSALQLIGEIRFNEDRLVHVVPRLTGVVESTAANAGDRVRKGQVLAVISSQALADQRSELLAAQKRLALARTTFEREKKLWEDKISAEQDYLQARNAMQEVEIAVQNAQQKLTSLGGGQQAGGNLTRYEIRAPIDGIIVEKHLSLGESVKEDANIFFIADLSTVWAEATIYAKDLNTVKVGQKATVKAAAFESQSSGTVSYVGALVGEQTRTAKARIVLPNPKGIWRPGLPVNIELVAGEVEVPVAVSAEAIQTVRDWTVVFGRYGANFEARPVELGRSDGKFTEVIKGLSAGERYAAKNSFLIKADLGKSGASHDH
ncbi:efflux RND transporter periplasmic adaptor subunit [Ferriphaselus sp. R-1]|uniref:efflux RND transporter periplasmic adaptor subunit n=1 Tax=Ferriphaselus sp. R-1 TaxID=1485544 RepID=UPI0005560276|nr:efflux RND transporter periplasmic adaptor subunit [Ferriphaselus sp. R-1]